MLKLLKNAIISGLIGAAIAGITFKILDKTPIQEEIMTPSVKDVATSDVVPSLEPVKITRIEVEPDQLIYFNVQVTYETVGMVINRLEQLSDLGIERVIIALDSPGGSVIDGATLISYMKASKMKIDTICLGLCASMAAQIHQAGKTRYMTEKSILMFHPASSRVEGSLEEMLSQLSTIKVYVDRLDAEVAARAGIRYETFKQLVVSELWVEGADALELGLTDKLAFVFTKSSFSEKVSTFDLKKQLGDKSVNNVKGIRDLK